MVSVLTGVTRFHKWATSYLPIDCIYMSELENINLHTDSVKCLGSRKLSWFVSLFMTGKQTAFMGSLASKEMNIAIHTQWWNEQEIHYGEKWFSGFSFHDLSLHPLLVFSSFLLAIIYVSETSLGVSEPFALALALDAGLLWIFLRVSPSPPAHTSLNASNVSTQFTF